jgi:hypothetical protein
MTQRSITPNTFTSQESALTIIGELQSHLGDALLNSGAIAIGTMTQKVKTAAIIYYTINGSLCTKAVTDDAFTLAGTVTNAKFNVFLLSINASGTCVATMGTEAATLAGVTIPAVPSGSVCVGLLIINPTGTGNFVGGTTALTDGTVVPNAVYIDTPFPFNPATQVLPWA